MTEEPKIIRRVPLAVQVCAPRDYTDEQIVDFVNQAEPSGTSLGWGVCKDGSPDPGFPAGWGWGRIRCSLDPNRAHVVLGI